MGSFGLAWVVLVGLAAVGLGGVGLARADRSAVLGSAVLSLLCCVSTTGVYGVQMARAFSAVADAPPESRTALLSEAISQAQWVLAAGMGLTGIGVIVSFLGWLRVRQAKQEAAQ